MGVTTTTPASLVLGPGELSVDGTPVGATKENATFSITRTAYSPELNKSATRLKGAEYIITEQPKLTVMLAEFTLAELQRVLPNSSIAGDGTATAEVLSSSIGRVPDAAFVDVEFVVQPGDGRAVTIRLKNATVDFDEDVEAEFGNEAEGAFEVTFIGHADPATPEVSPYEIERALAA